MFSPYWVDRTGLFSTSVEAILAALRLGILSVWGDGAWWWQDGKMEKEVQSEIELRAVQQEEDMRAKKESPTNRPRFMFPDARIQNACLP